MSKRRSPTMAEMVNELFRQYHHPSGREYTHKEVEEGITQAAGRKIVDASYLSKLRTGTLKRPSLIAVEALCYFFPVDTSYFFPEIAAWRQRQANESETALHVALRSRGADPKVLREQLESLLRVLRQADQEQQNQGEG